MENFDRPLRQVKNPPAVRPGPADTIRAAKTLHPADETTRANGASATRGMQSLSNH